MTNKNIEAEEHKERVAKMHQQGVCRCCDNAHRIIVLRDKANAESLHTFEQKVREEERERMFTCFKNAHAKVVKNCEKHPNGARGCSYCGTNKMLKVVYGETMRRMRLSPTDISDNKETT